MRIAGERTRIAFVEMDETDTGKLGCQRLADVLKRLRGQAKKHYEELAVQEAADVANGSTNGSGAGT